MTEYVVVSAGPPVGLDQLPAEKLLTGRQVAQLLGITPSGWRSLVAQERAPRADDPGDLDAHPRRRTPKWRVSTVRQFKADRPSASWQRNREG